MSNLQTIPGIGKSSIELLEAAGFLDEMSLAKAGLDELVAELERANSILKIAKRAPRRGEVEKWLSAARERSGILPREEMAEPDAPLVAVNYEQNPDVAAMLAKAPSAQPLPPQLFIDNKLAVSDIPVAMMLNRVVGDLEVRVNETAVQRPSKASGSGPAAVQMGEGPVSRRDIDASRLRTIADFPSSDPRVATASSGNGEDRVALIRAPRESTNRGRNPESPFYVRGVLHSHPYQVMFGALVTLLMMVVLPLAIAASGLLLLSDLKPESFHWVPKWFLVFPCALPVAGLAYLIWGVGAGKCRICGQKLFVPKACRKNAKAHHVKFIGYIVPTALHMLVFRWFRCTYCGTPVRVKE